MWAVYKRTAQGWQRVTRKAWTFTTACNIAQALTLAGHGEHCANTI